MPLDGRTSGDRKVLGPRAAAAAESAEECSQRPLRTLEAGEDGVVDLALEVVELLDAGRVLGAHAAPEEDERRARPTQRLVRRRGHYVAQLERRAHHAGRHQSCTRRAGDCDMGDCKWVASVKGH